MTRKDIEFRTEDGVTLRGWLYTPDRGSGPFPTIIVELFLEYEPHVYLPLISPAPLMMVVASGDHLTVQDIALKHYANALEPKRLLLVPGGHFDAYVGEVFTHNSAEQLAWFTQHLA